MRHRVFLFCAALVIAVGAATTAAQAQASRTWVSGVGDDANPCSRTAPCKTFAGAISKTAAGGEISVLDPGGFGAVTITKAITIDGGGGQVASVLAANPSNGIVVQAGATDKVELRNLRINGIAQGGNGGNNGINFISGGGITVQNCWIGNFTNEGINLQSSNVNGVLTVVDSIIEANQNGGIAISSPIATPSRVNILRTTLTRNGNLGSSPVAAISATNATDVIIDSSWVVNNGAGGVSANGTAARVSITNSNISNNQQFGVHSMNSAVMALALTTVAANNGTGLLADTGGAIFSFSNNFVAGNTTDGARTGTIAPM